jgi:2-methylcitrate dehydratase PrpD
MNAAVKAVVPEQTGMTRGERIASYVEGALERDFPADVIDAAKQALVDFIGVAVGAANDEPVQPVRKVAESWAAQGNAQIFLGKRTTPALAALVNGTMAHAMDYDDTHPLGAGHISGPCWSTALAMASHHGSAERATLAAFITGFEIMARLGTGGPAGVGRNLHRRGFHPTAVLGRPAAAAVASVLLKLDRQRVAYALGAAATMSAGLVGSFGTHAKPFHAGKAAMDGITAAQLAAEGFVAATHLFELEKGMLDSFIQNREVEVPPLDFEDRWEILRNGYKPFASCRATHASSEAAHTLATLIAGKTVKRVRAQVHPNALITAAKRSPRTPLEGKFSVPFCVALSLRGYRLKASDFSEERLRDASVMDIVPTVEMEGVEGQPQHEAHLDVYLESGEHLHADTTLFLGHPDNPMTWDDTHAKFQGLVEPMLGAEKAGVLYENLRRFEEPGTLGSVMALLAR